MPSYRKASRQTERTNQPTTSPVWDAHVWAIKYRGAGRRDMLAWVHQALASERELFVSLFGDESEAPPAELSADMPSIAALLDRVFEGICKPLKVGGGCGCRITAVGFQASRPGPSPRLWLAPGRGGNVSGSQEGG